MIELKESQAQSLTWKLKDDAWKEVEHLPLEEAIARRLAISAEAIRELGFEHRVRDPRIHPIPVVSQTRQ